ncbi:copper resistance protein B [Acinetobacter sp. ANC 4973]|uniref:copper resistance protein B n=1 Tax=Acinetobacter sp. ANC 4973 TaxID=1977871 RepID=UPI000A338C2E|nr:copper resistance protein B [Acinetobacter sp. ANC 4973]OTG96788.1 copper resistance protein CopB [Acinetobacter sp. ANC 4973]
MRSINLFAMSTLSASLLVLSGQSFAHEGHHAMSMSEQQTQPAEDIPMDHSQHQKMSAAPQVVEEKQMQPVQLAHSNSDGFDQDHKLDYQFDHKVDHAAHLKEHGGQIYQQTILESKWLRNDDGRGVLKSELETRIGTDENKIFIKVHTDKAESAQAEYDAKLLYSRNVADFWDVQAGLRYRNDPNREIDQDQVDAVLGLHGMAPYFFETDAYVYIGQDRQVSFNLETERDLLLTQKWIVKPYLDINMVLSDDSNYAKKTGLNSAQVGLEIRYEINKKVMPFMDLAYGYNKGVQETARQKSSSSENAWFYGAGLRFKF